MSLTSHIREGNKSPIGRFFLERFPYLLNVTKEANPQLRSVGTVRPTGAVPRQIYSTLGTALGYRLSYYFGTTRSDELLAWNGAWSLILKPVEHDSEVPITINEWATLSHIKGLSWSGGPQARGPYSRKLLRSFFWNLDRTLERIQPCGRRLEAKEERLLGRYCYILALFEQVLRLGSLGQTSDSPLFEPHPKSNMKELMAIPKVETLEDLSAMSWLFYDRCIHLFPHTINLSVNPHFAGSADVGGADADLIIDNCLIEVKASIEPTMKPEYLRQLAGYLLLDYEDTYKIESVGLYMARQGLLFRWPVERFLQMLTGDFSPSLTSLRQDLRTCCGEWLAEADRQATEDIGLSR